MDKPLLLLIAHYYDFTSAENRLALMEELRSLSQDYEVTLLQTILKTDLKAIGSVKTASKPLVGDVDGIRVINVPVYPTKGMISSWAYKKHVQTAIENAGQFDYKATFGREVR